MELEAVKKLNSELKEQGYKFSLEIYRASYYARGTLKQQLRNYWIEEVGEVLLHI
jgi:hypothetical protein